MASTSGSLAAQVINSGDLVDLVSSSSSATIYPTDEHILSALHARFRADLPYTRIGTSNLVVVNPYKTLANVNDVSAREYEERCYKDTSLPLVDSPKPLQPHVYELAAKIYLLMRRREESQSIITRGITGSGKSASSRLLVSQVLRLSSHSRREAKIAEQINALIPLLDAFGNAKTPMSPNASRHSRYLELHFNAKGRISSGKVLVFGLDKSRLNRLLQEERSFHVFYQLLAGATPEERDYYNLEDPSDYALLASSGCYRLPAGPGSDDSIAMEDLRGCMATLGFKPKHTASIFSLLVAILLLGNIEFSEADHSDVSAYVVNAPVLDHAARLLGISSEDLTQALTNKTNYVRKDLYTSLLNVHQSAAQRDHLVRDLYAILFAYVVEHANHKIAPSKDVVPATQIVVFDQPGYQTHAQTGTSSMAFSSMPLVSAMGENGFDDFCINFADEVVQSYVFRNVFEDAVGYNSHMTGDGVTLPEIQTMDNSACVELLRGAQLNEKASRKPNGMLGIMAKTSSAFKSGKGGDKRDEDMLQDLVAKVGVHASFVASPNVGGTTDRNLFGINHYAGNCTYDVSGFVERNSDMLDSAFVSLLRNSSQVFVSRLLSGPSLAAEKHSKDESIVVQAQVSSRPLRQPTTINASTPAEEPSQLDPAKVYPVTTQLNHTLAVLMASIDRTHLWTMSCIRPNDSGSANSFDKRRVKAQIRALLLPELVARRSTEFVADYELSTFCERYVPTMQGSESERIRQCAAANGWQEGLDYKIGHRAVWLSYFAWKMIEDGLRAAEKGRRQAIGGDDDDESMADDATDYTHGAPQGTNYDESNENLLLTRRTTNGSQYLDANSSSPYGAGGLRTPGSGMAPEYSEAEDVGGWGPEWDKKGGRPDDSDIPTMNKEGGMTINPAPNTVEEIPTSRSRRWWLFLVWGSTGLIPSFLLEKVGRMKRPDVRLAWREKVCICLLILLLNCTVIFYIVEFGRLLCPNFDKAWNTLEVSEHQATNDYWVAIQGSVYDVSDFVAGDHSDISGVVSNGADSLEALAGTDMTWYFPPPLALACPYLVTDNTLAMQYSNWTATITEAKHNSGGTQQDQTTKLDDSDWYTARFQPTIKKYYKGPFVFSKNEIESAAADPDTPRNWAVYDGSLYDLTNYVYTLAQETSSTSTYGFLDTDIVAVFKNQAGQDVTKALNTVFASKDTDTVDKNMECIKNAFFYGTTDFRDSARCKVQNIILVTISGILMGSMVIKFIASLQLGTKRNPEMQDKFVLCQVPCYTEGEDSLRRTIDSLAALNYDDKRKLIFIICDGNIIGSGNDRTTPRIVLDILGVDPKLDPEPLLFKSVGEGSKQINYGKVYSGLYEFEGHVVPYMVTVKVGKPTERSKPGNRGKRDSQVLVMHYLNRVHFDAPMSPLELEIYHQMRNVIGIDPAFYEYIFTIDADTSVTPDSLNRLVAASADDQSIIGVCGETKLENEQGSWWTMIQVYEYYISHHLSKSFESLFGSVTCLPGCFTLYRIRTSDKGRPIIISNRVIDDYSEGNVDTLHKKNLFSLGEDRYLTTLLMKHFPTFRTKFIPHAKAQTVAPEAFRVLFSQRRRWINSTIHNLCELVALSELCGICCFSMRFFVFIDLLGTLILPATVVYLVYLIIVVATHQAPLPIISLIMIGATYGLQALVFVIHREFMLIGWMVVYLISYPVYSFFLPIYSFWCMDEFGWGNTRLVIGEGGSRKVLVPEEDKYDDSMIPLKKFSEYEAEAWETGTRHSDDTYDTKPRSQLPPKSHAESAASYNHASQSGDYYRDTNPMSKTSQSNLRGPSQAPSIHSFHQNALPPNSQFGGLPHLPFMPFAGGPGSVVGSDHGSMHMPRQMGYQNTGSAYGMMPADPRNTMMTNFNMFGGSGSVMGGMGPPPSLGAQPRPMSTFSMATTANMFAGPSQNPNPTDEDLVNALRNYLSTQDLMTVTKKTAREAMASRFPKADLASRKDFLNHSIDSILSQS